MLFISWFKSALRNNNALFEKFKLILENCYFLLQSLNKAGNFDISNQSFETAWQKGAKNDNLRILHKKKKILGKYETVIKKRNDPRKGNKDYKLQLYYQEHQLS